MTEMTLEPLPARESPSVEIARRLLAYLLSGQVKPGGRLPSERELASQLGVGRSAVRDALRPLLLLGLLEARQGDGTYLKRPDSRLLAQAVEWGLLLGEHTTFDLIEARLPIEVALARLAAVRRDAAALEKIRAPLERMATAGDDRAVFATADLEFHLQIADASGNAALAGVLDSIQSLLRVWIRRVSSAASETNSSYLEHVPIFKAIERGDPDGAAEAMGVHLGSATAKLGKTLDPRGGLDPSPRPAVVDSA